MKRVKAKGKKKKEKQLDYWSCMSEMMTYMLGIVVELFHEEYNWDTDDLEWLACKILEKYNSVKDVDHYKKRLEELSGLKFHTGRSM